MRTASAVARAAGAPFRLMLLGAIRLYRLLSAGLAPRCKYYPSCSSYAEEAVGVHGAVRGGLLGVWRLLRCNPFSSGGVDHVPQRRRVYESVIRSPGGRP